MFFAVVILMKLVLCSSNTDEIIGQKVLFIELIKEGAIYVYRDFNEDSAD